MRVYYGPLGPSHPFCQPTWPPLAPPKRDQVPKSQLSQQSAEDAGRQLNPKLKLAEPYLEALRRSWSHGLPHLIPGLVCCHVVPSQSIRQLPPLGHSDRCFFRAEPQIWTGNGDHFRFGRGDHVRTATRFRVQAHQAGHNLDSARFLQRSMPHQV